MRLIISHFAPFVDCIFDMAKFGTVKPKPVDGILSFIVEH